MDPPGGSFDPRATLRKLSERDSVLDALVRRIGARWDRFRADASPASLEAIRRDLKAALAQLSSLRTLLEGSSPLDGWAEPPPRAMGVASGEERPAREREAREGAEAGRGRDATGRAAPSRQGRAAVVRGPDAPPTSRVGAPAEEGEPEDAESSGSSWFGDEDLELFLREARAGWERLLQEPTPQALGRLEGEVRRLLDRAEALRREAHGEREAEPGGAEGRDARDDEALAEPRPPYAGTAADGSHAEEEAGEEEAGETSTSRAAEGAGPSERQSETTRSAERRGVDRGAEAAAFPPFRDGHTGLLTREGFDVLASGELKRSRRHGRPFAFLILRPRVGEGEPLRALGTGIRRSLRESDLIGRYGGVDLAIGLPETGASEALTVADRLRAELERRDAWGGEAAAALAVHPRDGETLLTLADAARTRLIGAAATSLNAEPADPRGEATNADVGPDGRNADTDRREALAE